TDGGYAHLWSLIEFLLAGLDLEWDEHRGSRVRRVDPESVRSGRRTLLRGIVAGITDADQRCGGFLWLQLDAGGVTGHMACGFTELGAVVIAHEGNSGVTVEIAGGGGRVLEGQQYVAAAGGARAFGHPSA